MRIQNKSRSLGSCVVVAASALALSACTAQTPPAASEQAPEVALDALEGQDQGWSYGGWTQSSASFICTDYTLWWIDHTLQRSSGPSTRGGGACAVRYTGASCTSDTTCTTAAQSQYGSAAYGYCYSGKCYSRPGAQSTYCGLNPNRSPGTIGNGGEFSLPGFPSSSYYSVGCMTKAAGPSFACGGTDTTLYMRYMEGFTSGPCF